MIMNTLTPGKWRGMRQTSSTRGTFCVLALDHRGSLRRALHPEDQSATSHEEMVLFKQEVIRTLAPATTAVLTDPVYGATAAITYDGLPGGTGLMLAAEQTGYEGERTDRLSRVVPGWDIRKAKQIGASAIKLLVYFNPDADNAPHQEALLDRVIQECTREDIPLFLEILTFSLDPDVRKLPSAQKREVVTESVHVLVRAGVDVLKVEFPLAPDAPEEEWARACRELNSAAHGVPWTVLSAGVNFETFIRQMTAACEAGASGALVGRAVWKEATDFKGAERVAFLKTVAFERMRRLTALCDALGRPWTECYQPPMLEEGWFEGYGS